MDHWFFDADEEIVLYKKKVIRDMSEGLERFKVFFRGAHASKKHNPRYKKDTLEGFTLDAIFFLLVSSCLLGSHEDHAAIISNVACYNYNLNDDQCRRLMAALEDLCQQEEIIISFCNKMRQRKDAMLRTHQFERVMELYRRHLTPRFYEKKNKGQVFTPFPLVDRILDHIPTGVMTDPTSTFLDPSAGMGGFLVFLHKRLMGTLADAIPNRRKRHHHIVSKMLYAAEISPNNVALMKKVFGSDLHVYAGDALQMDLGEAFGLRGVRVIVGNPPFEKPQTDVGSVRGGGDSLWPFFVRKCLDEWLLPGGWFGMVLPPGWRKPGDERSRTFGLWDLLTVKNTPLRVEMYDEDEASSFFEDNVKIRVDLVVVEKKANRHHRTFLRGTDGKHYKQDLSAMPFLPNANLSQWRRVLTKGNEDGVPVLHSSVYITTKNNKKVREERGGAFRFPLIHSIHKDGKLILRYTNKKLDAGGFGVPKVVFLKLGQWNKPFLDAKGEYGTTQNTFAIPIRSVKEGEEIVRYFTKERLASFQDDLNWSTSLPGTDHKLFRYIKKGFWRA